VEISANRCFKIRSEFRSNDYYNFRVFLELNFSPYQVNFNWLPSMSRFIRLSMIRDLRFRIQCVDQLVWLISTVEFDMEWSQGHGSIAVDLNIDVNVKVW